MIVVPINPTPLPTPPSTSDPANFDPRADAFLGGLPTFQTQTNELAAATYQNALDSVNSATSSYQNALLSSQSAAGAQATANYKGEWSSLSGALSMPATVSHQGRMWYLKQALVNVASQQPVLGSAFWGEVGKNQFVTYLAPAGNTNAVDQGLYVMTNANSVLVLPANPADGMIVAAVNTSGTLTPFINRNGKTILGDAENFTLNVLNFQIVIQYFAATNNWVQVMGVTAYTSAQPTVNSSNTFNSLQNFTGGLNLNGISVISRGSNSDGEYVRFADGTQICWKVSGTMSIASAAGSIFVNGAAVDVTPWPVPFYTMPQVVYTGQKLDGAGHCWAAAVSRGTNTQPGSFQLFRATSSTDAFYAQIVGIGRWF